MELYIHIPFCVKKCDYCDFLSFPNCDGTERKKYISALIRELEMISGLPSFRKIKSCFIGGGTPSIIEEEIFEPLLKCIQDNFTFEEEFEYTIEANPGTLTERKLLLYREYGINRLSIGLQSDRDESLKRLGRIHNRSDFVKGYETAVKCGFENINIDLMSAIPGQTVSEWKTTLENICRLGPGHISAYSLIIEEGTPLYEKYCSDPDSLCLPNEDDEREMYHITPDIMKKYGYHRYEISNYSREGAECRHNLGYWTGETYYGAGLGASSYINVNDYKALLSGVRKKDEEESSNISGRMVRFKNTSSLNEYLEYYGEKNKFSGYTDVEILDTEDMMSEYCILGLRTCRGISVKEFEEKFGEDFNLHFGPVIKKYSEMKLLEKNGDRIYFTEKGFDVSNAVLCDFM